AVACGDSPPALACGRRRFNPTGTVSLHGLLLDRQATTFDTVIRTCGCDVLKLFDTAARPGDDDTIHVIPPANAEGDGQFRLGQIAGAGLHHPGLIRPLVEDAYDGADGIAVGFGADQAESKRAVARKLIDPEQQRWTSVGGHQKIEITIPAEIAER